VVKGATLKLEATGLSHFFPIGAFGSDSPHRPELVDVAVERAYHQVGYRFSQKEIAIIGDTPHDIHCGRHRGVKAIAVATGPFSHEELRLHDPDYLFSDFSCLEPVLAAILA
jgi:phosphoglycolate phosphatase-like HAD superfamily hydrolase